ncbi:hypothetical protein H8K52_18675 [Undibacterium seohonense]|uniref:ABC-2 type transport system permease protein n=1 Tax=Undibacterium seohonense TaxID=1344950 RepID=A0ABR6X974_9BURK|nr:hypothetical protein [Undibacterium seohonense]MBC3809370.1 hypothetical protein [Undibacterium seohonense]
MKPILNLWVQPIYARMNLDGKKSLYWILSIFPLVGLLLAFLVFLSNRQKYGAEIFLYAFLMSLGVMLVIVFVVWFLILAQYQGQQYSPANAGLIPRIKRYMQIAIALPIVLAACVITMISFVVDKHFSIWPAFVCVTGMLFFAISVRSPWMMVPMILSFQLPGIFERAGYQKLDQAVEVLGIPFSLFLFITMIMMLVAGIHWMFSAKGDALFKMHKRTLAFQDGINGKKSNDNKITLGFSTLFFRWMEQNVRAHQRQGAVSKSSLLIFCLSPRLHWTTIAGQMFGLLVAGIFAVTLLQVLLMRNSYDFILGFGVGFGGLVALILPVTMVLMLFFTVYQTRAEQSILSLAPNLGNSAQQNKTYMRYLTKQFFILYGISVLAACLIAKFGNLSEMKLAMLSLFLTCLFPLSLSLTVRFGHMKSVHDHPLMKLLLSGVLLFVVGGGLALAISPKAVWGYCGVVLVVTSIMLWKKMQSNLQNNMFPVGRAV